MSETEFDKINNDEDFEEEFSTLSLLDDSGNEVHFEILDEFDYKDESFIVLLPYEESDDDVVILQVISAENDEDSDEFISIEDESLLYAVFDEFKKRNAEYYDFKD